MHLAGTVRIGDLGNGVRETEEKSSRYRLRRQPEVVRHRTKPGETSVVET